MNFILIFFYLMRLVAFMNHICWICIHICSPLYVYGYVCVTDMFMYGFVYTFINFLCYNKYILLTLSKCFILFQIFLFSFFFCFFFIYFALLLSYKCLFVFVFKKKKIHSNMYVYELLKVFHIYDTLYEHGYYQMLDCHNFSMWGLNGNFLF